VNWTIVEMNHKSFWCSAFHGGKITCWSGLSTFVTK
jgi:hypothetical protein